MADRKPLVPYSAMKARSLAACSAELHHAAGRDLQALLGAKLDTLERVTD
jgi:hypothetical protein